jgi:hypothetical protein
VHGGLTSCERQSALHEFTHGRADVLLATDAASEGLNLQQRCRRIINIELPWTPLRLEQRIGRVDRIGQSRVVHATHLVARGTLEDDIVARLLARASTAEAALAGFASHDEGAIVAAATSTMAAPASSRPVPHGGAQVVVPDLRTTARREAEAIAATRQLRASARDIDDGRPVITKIRRGSPPSRTWAVRLHFADRDSCVRWTTILGMHAGEPFPRGDLRGALDASFIDSTLDEVCESLRAQILDRAERFTLTAIAREDAILASIHASRQRIVPVSRGLFDRRDEHAASVQAEILTDAARQCGRRRRQLTSLLPVALCRSELAFALVSE